MRPRIKLQQTYHRLRNIIFQLQPGEYLGKTIRELAAEFGVSHKTVSAAVKQLNTDGLIIVKKKAGIRVHPDLADHTQVTGWLVIAPVPPRNAHIPLMDKIKDSVRPIAREHNLGIKLWTMQETLEQEELFRMGMIKGMITLYYLDDKGNQDLIDLGTRYGVSVCAFDELVPHVDSVIWDNGFIGRKIGWMLFGTSRYQHVLLITRLSYAETIFEREEGIRETLVRLNIPQNRTRWLSLVTAEEWIHQYLEDYIAGGLRFDAAYVCTSTMGPAIRTICRTHRLPEPFIVGAGPLEDLQHNQIAGAMLDITHMARTAAELVTQRMADPFREAEHIKIECGKYYPQ